MPYVNLRLLKDQVTSEQRNRIVNGLTDLIVNIMGRDRNFTVITIDELEKNQWAIGGKTLSQIPSESKVVSFVNIKVSKGTTNAEEISLMMKATKELMVEVLGNSDETNYFIMDELNSDGWGFDGLSMTERARMQY